MAELTPVMKQYLGIKARYEDAILLFRLGDFYEMFGNDAKVASAALQIALTTRDKNKAEPLPMCGIPYFAAENYITKLVKAGHKVAICEQVSDPKDTKGIVAREVVRVITPGTHDPESPKENNYIMAICPRGELHGIAVADVSTGEFKLYETDQPFEDELTGYNPTEIVLPESLEDSIYYREALTNYYVSTMPDWKFDFTDTYRALLRHFRVTSLEGFGCEGFEAGIAAGGALITYLEEGQQDPPRFRRISTPVTSAHMFLDATTQRNLELVRNLKDGGREGTLLWALDETLTPMGGRFLRNAILRPLTDYQQIVMRHNAIRYLTEDFELLDRLRSNLREVQDVERLAQRIATGRAGPRDLIATRNSVEHFPAIKNGLLKALDPRLKDLGSGMADLAPLSELIAQSIVDQPPQNIRDGGIIRKGFNEEVDQLRSLAYNAKDYIASIEAEERKSTGISTLKVGYNRIHGYYIEVTKSNLDLVPYHYERKQTLVGAERFIIPELKEYESRVLGAEEKLKTLEYEIFMGIIESAGRYCEALLDMAGRLADIDFLVSMTIIARRHNYVMPLMNEAHDIRIMNGRHPVIERLNLTDRFIPNDALLDGDAHRLLIITGPNMAGKSTFMRQVALICLMAQMGGFVPAEEALLGIVDRIFTRIGASDYLTRGQSTFMVEMVETANILNNATNRSLILLDEVGRGTSTFDGISIAWATAEYISEKIRARTLFATHYNELTDLAHKLEGIRNYNILVKEWGDEIVFLRRIESGPADKSYGIQVARLAGLPDEVIAGAKEVLKRLEKQHMGIVAMKTDQMDLFAAPKEDFVESMLRIDTEKLSPEDVVRKLKALQKMASS